MRILDTDPFPQRAVIVFNHVTKAGGTSLFAFLQATFGAERCHWHKERDRVTHEIAPALGELPERTLRVLRVASGHFDYGMHERLEALLDRRQTVENLVFNIGLVRDPLERLLSDYHFSREQGSPKYREIALSMDFDAYVRSKLKNPNSIMARNSQIEQIAGTQDLKEAEQVLQSRYLLAATTDQINEMLRLLHAYFGNPGRPRKMCLNGSEASRQELDALDPGLVKEFRSRTEVDLALVERVSELFEVEAKEWRSQHRQRQKSRTAN